MLKIKTLERVPFYLAALALITPLVFLETSYVFPFIVPKTLYFRIITALMLGVYLVLLGIHKKTYGLRVSVLHVAVGAFFLSFLISTFTGVDWYRSMWDSHERMLGLFTLFHYIVFYVVATATIREWKDWKKLLHVFLSVGIVVMLLGVWQRFVNPDAMLNKGSERVSATLGNPIYFSAFGMFLFFMGIYLYIKERQDKHSRVIAISASVLGFLGLLLGGSRGMFIGMLAGLGTAYISLWVHYRKVKKINIACTAVFLVVVAILGLLFVNKDTEFVSNLPTIGRLATTNLGNLKGDTRVMAWDVALDAWQEKPVFGWGPNNYMYAFNAFYRPEFLKAGWNETWFDNAHSVPFNTLAVQGLVGLVAYLSMFVAAWYLIVRARKEGRLASGEAIILGSFLVAHFVSNFFIFENPTSYLYFFFTLALIYTTARHDPATATPATTGKVPSTLFWSTAIVIALFIYATDINPGKANKQALATIRSLITQRTDALALLDESLKTPTPHVDDIRADFARSAIDNAPRYIQKGENEYARELLLRSFDELEKNKALHPREIRASIDQATVTRRLAEYYGDPSLLPRAEVILEEALQYAPGRQQIVYILAAQKSSFAKHDEAQALMQSAVEATPDIPEGWWRYANTFWFAGEIERAREIIEEARGRGFTFDQMGELAAERIFSSTTPPQLQ